MASFFFFLLCLLQFLRVLHYIVTLLKCLLKEKNCLSLIKSVLMIFKSNLTSVKAKLATPVAVHFCALNWQRGGARFNLRTRLSTQPFGVFIFFSETRVNTGQDPLERPPRRAFHPVLGPTSGQLDLKYRTNQLTELLNIQFKKYILTIYIILKGLVCSQISKFNCF